jgi:hypothetical protein
MLCPGDQQPIEACGIKNAAIPCTQFAFARKDTPTFPPYLTKKQKAELLNI